MKKKAKIILISIVISVVALAGLVSAFLINYNTYSPEAPVVLDDGKNIFITTSLNDNYVGYRFKFIDENNDEIIIDSQDNILSSKDVIEKGCKLGETYKISTCYIAQNKGNDSKYSKETEWLCQTYLASTTIMRDYYNNILFWNAVEDADFYRVYINNNSGQNYIQTSELSIDLQSMKGGQKVAYVVAYSNNLNIKTSDKSNIIEFNLQHYFSEFSTISFDKETKVLTATNSELFEKLDVLVGDKTYNNIKFEVEEGDSFYTYTVDLTTVYNDESIIGISPSDIDEFNVFIGAVKTLTI